MPEVTLNYWAVLVAALTQMVIGFIWYSPLLFGKVWVKSMGWSHEELEKHKKDAPMAYLGSFLAALVMSYVLAVFVDYSVALDALDGLEAGFWLWLGFIATTLLSGSLFEGKKFSHYLVSAGYYLVALLSMGATLGSWQ